MKHERYMSWFRQIVEMGWACGLFSPQEILANYLLHFYQFAPKDEQLPYDHIERWMVDFTTIDWGRPDSNKPTLAEAIKHFNRFYKDGRMDFGVYTRMGVN